MQFTSVFPRKCRNFTIIHTIEQIFDRNYGLRGNSGQRQMAFFEDKNEHIALLAGRGINSRESRGCNPGWIVLAKWPSNGKANAGGGPACSCGGCRVPDVAQGKNPRLSWVEFRSLAGPTEYCGVAGRPKAEQQLINIRKQNPNVLLPPWASSTPLFLQNVNSGR